jgi:hypothetical protein
MCLCDLLVVLIYYLGGYTFHTEDLEIETLTSGVGILNVGERLLVDLVHMHGET